MVKNSPGKQNYGYAAISASYDTSKEKKRLVYIVITGYMLKCTVIFSYTVIFSSIAKVKF